MYDVFYVLLLYINFDSQYQHKESSQIITKRMSNKNNKERPICIFFNSNKGCNKGQDCEFIHSKPKPDQNNNKAKPNTTAKRSNKAEEGVGGGQVVDSYSMMKKEYLMGMIKQMIKSCNICKKEEHLVFLGCGCDDFCFACTQKMKCCPKHFQPIKGDEIIF